MLNYCQEIDKADNFYFCSMPFLLNLLLTLLLLLDWAETQCPPPALPISHTEIQGIVNAIAGNNYAQQFKDGIQTPVSVNAPLPGSAVVNCNPTPSHANAPASKKRDARRGKSGMPAHVSARPVSRGIALACRSGMLTLAAAGV